MRALSDATAGMLKPVPLSHHDRLEIDIDKELKKFTVRIAATFGHFPSTTARSMWLQRVPERKQLADLPNTWQLAATDYTAEIIRALWPDDQIVWKDDRARQVFDYLLLSTTQQDILSEVYARFKESGALPDDIGDMLIHPEVPLNAYQQCALYMAMRSEGFGYFMEQGTGKTPLVVTEICNLAARTTWENPVRALIVPPKNVRVNWVHEFERFSMVPGQIEVIKGGEMRRVTDFIRLMVPDESCKFKVAVMSYESMVRSLDNIQHVMNEVLFIDRLNLVALDESHFIKWPMTKRCKAAFRLRDMAERRRVLTGTPVCNTPLDLYSQFEFMGEGWSGFRSWENFREFYGVFKETEGSGHQKLVGVQNLPFMKERLARTSFIISLKEALPELPERVFDTDEVEMTARQAEVYEQVASELLVEIENELDETDNKSMTISNILTKLLRLAQICSGYVVWDAVVDPHSMEELCGKSIEWFAQDPKLERLIEILEEKQPHEKTLVWSCFVPCIGRISERLKLEGIDHVTYYGGTSDEDRVEAERRFNCDRDCRVFVGNPGAGGVGLNLLGYPPHAGEGYETNADHAIYYVQDWSYTKRAQSGARNHRKGTRVRVRETDLVVPETIDEEIRIRVLKKKKVAMEISDIREILSAVLHGIKPSERDEETADAT